MLIVLLYNRTTAVIDFILFFYTVTVLWNFPVWKKPKQWRKGKRESQWMAILCISPTHLLKVRTQPQWAFYLSMPCPLIVKNKVCSALVCVLVCILGRVWYAGVHFIYGVFFAHEMCWFSTFSITHCIMLKLLQIQNLCNVSLPRDYTIRSSRLLY